MKFNLHVNTFTCNNFLKVQKWFFHWCINGSLMTSGIASRSLEIASSLYMFTVILLLLSSLTETCPKCSHNRAFFMQIQTRSADEPMTTFYKCCNMGCAHRWRDWILCQCCDGLRTQTWSIDIGETVIHRAEDSIYCFIKLQVVCTWYLKFSLF